jgi:hypothetical protein
VITQKDGHRNRYQIQAYLLVPSQAPGSRPSARSSPCSQPGDGQERGPPGPVTMMLAAAARRNALTSRAGRTRTGPMRKLSLRPSQVS